MNRCVLSWSIAIFLVLGIALQSSWKAEAIDTSTWDLPQLINHLKAGGLSFDVVSARQDGKIGNCAYLIERPGATWLEFQEKTRSLATIDQWKQAVWIERLSPHGGIDWYVEQWGQNGCQIDRFVFFGDAQLIQRVLQTFKR